MPFPWRKMRSPSGRRIFPSPARKRPSRRFPLPARTPPKTEKGGHGRSPAKNGQAPENEKRTAGGPSFHPAQKRAVPLDGETALGQDSR
ncbi:MAG: hypothetical protein C6W56_09705 [Caldibacillus debilis]|nr:MAG: hypothetical protein C6W56_09705 [Caldibacillus debilis]